MNATNAFFIKFNEISTFAVDLSCLPFAKMGTSNSKDKKKETIEDVDIDARMDILSIDKCLQLALEWTREGHQCLFEADLKASHTAFKRAYVMVEFFVNSGRLNRTTWTNLLGIQAHLSNCIVRLAVALEEIKLQQSDKNREELTAEEFRRTLKLPDIALKEKKGKCESEKSEVVSAIKTLIAEVDVCKPKIELNEIIGQLKAVEAIKHEMYFKRLSPESYAQVENYNGLMLYGPPGNGKTTIAKATATMCGNMPFFKVNTSQLFSKWKGQSEKAVRALFMIAQVNGPAIIFIDEVEALFETRSGTDGNDSVGSGIVQLFLDMVSSHDKVFIICATNVPWKVDEAFYRRFRAIYLSMPTRDERLTLLKRVFNKGLHHLLMRQDFEDICDRMDGFSFDDINKVHAQCSSFVHNFSNRFKYMKETTNVLGFDESWTPCHRHEPGAVENCTEVLVAKPNLKVEIAHPPITMAIVLHILSQYEKTVSKETLEKNETFRTKGLDGLRELSKKERNSAP